MKHNEQQTGDPQFPIQCTFIINGELYTVQFHWSQILKIQQAIKENNPPQKETK